MRHCDYCDKEFPDSHKMYGTRKYKRLSTIPVNLWQSSIDYNTYMMCSEICRDAFREKNDREEFGDDYTSLKEEVEAFLKGPDVTS